MLSRSNSNAGERLRRAKSNASAVTASSGHLRSSTSIDPFVTQQYAEAAAIEAYSRAHPNEPSYSTYRPVPPKIHRRKSQVTGKSEGSHFEDSRLGRRKSTSTKDDTKAVKQSHASRQRASRTTTEVDCSVDGQEKVITRRRSVIPPTAYAHSRSEHSDQPNNRQLRRARSAYTDGRPTPRYSSQLTDHSSTLQVRTPTRNPDHYSGHYAGFSGFHSDSIDVPQTVQSVRPSIRETQTDEEILTLARDKCIQDFHHRIVDKRKSFILAPFQKRRATKEFKVTDEDYDNTLPPFNYAMDSTMPLPSEPMKSSPPHSPTPKLDRKTGNFSDTLKGRIKKVFRKTSRTANTLPPQQAQTAQSLRRSHDPAYRNSVMKGNGDPMIVITPGSPIKGPDHRYDRAESRSSYGRASSIKSRVTSWTNSTVAGTWSSRAEDNNLHPVDENGAIREKNSKATLRKASSFFGNPVVNKLRRASRSDLCSSEESQGLFSALQERIRPTKHAKTPVANTASDSPHLRVPSGRSDLPSQKRSGSISSVSSRRNSHTIRPVSSASQDQHFRVPSPVAEVLSPNVDTATESLTNFASTARGHRRSNMQAVAPSQEQMMRRMEKSKNRWQSSLDELSGRSTALSKPTVGDENPFELPTMRRTTQQISPNRGLPHSTKVEQPPKADRHVLSPSLYSRGTTSVSPQPDSPPDLDGTMITITGREVRRYSISPKKDHPVEPERAQGSREWRRWLSSEMDGLKFESDDYDLQTSAVSNVMASSPPVASGHIVRDSKSDNSEATSMSPILTALSVKDVTNPSRGNTSPPIDHAPVAKRPPRSRANSSQRSSFMNDRYPMLDTARNSSDKSIGSRGFSSRTGNRHSSIESQNSGRPKSVYVQSEKITDQQTHKIQPRQSIAKMETSSSEQTVTRTAYTTQRRSALTTKPTTTKTEPDSTTATSSSSSNKPIHRPKSSLRPKSAFDLRANFKANNTTSKPLEVHRKATTINNSIKTDITEDETLLAISAGPYASSQAPFTSDSNEENTTPDGGGLPALSSSEWLAAGPNKSRRVESVHPALRERVVSRRGEGKGGGKEGRDGVKGKDGGSPAQKMATEFLEKRSRESTPAFM